MAARRSELRVAERLGRVRNRVPGATEVTVSPGQAREGGDTGPAAPLPHGSVGAIEWVSIPRARGAHRHRQRERLPPGPGRPVEGRVKIGRRYVVNYSAFVEASRAPMTPAALRS